MDSSTTVVPDTEAFVFPDGKKVHSLQELRTALFTLDNAHFVSHVNGQKNDFAAWISHSLHDPVLAARALEVTTKEELINLLPDSKPEEQNPFDQVVTPAQESTDGFAPPQENPSPQETSSPPSIDTSSLASEISPESPTKDSLLSLEIEEPQSKTEEAKPIQKEQEVQETASQKNDPSQFKPAPKVDMSHIDSEGFRSEQRGTHEPAHTLISEDEAKKFSGIVKNLKSEIAKVFIGQVEIVDRIILALMCDAHALLEGVPGLAKSLLVEVLSKVIEGTSFSRIQFLPDLLPSDVIGGQIYNPKTATFSTIKGPIFANFVLADEINRAPPKTHAALMEAMQEKKINIDVDEFILDKPFLVLATQNPLENKGTYQLPEAVLDRFMFKIDLPYPKREFEKIIITQNATTQSKIKEGVKYVLDKEEFLHMQRKVKEVYISDRIKEYILDLIEATRGSNKNIEGRQFIQYGGGPRASIYLGIASKARAVTQGRNFVMPEDVVYVAPDILRHRLSLNFKGKAHNISTDKIVEEILTKVNAL